MSETNDVNLNEEVTVVVEDATVITVPIDDTLTISGEAADAKATGDALANKADVNTIMEHVTITVDGVESDNQGVILIDGSDIPLTDANDAPKISAAVAALDAKTGADIAVSGTDSTKINAKLFADQLPMSSDDATTISAAIGTAGSRTGNDIAMSSTDQTTVKAGIEAVGTRVTAIEGKYLKKELQELTSTEKATVRTNLSLGGAATQDVMNGLTTDSQGYVLDARQGAVLNSAIGTNAAAITALQNWPKKVNISDQITYDNLDSNNTATIQNINCYKYGVMCHFEFNIKFSEAQSASCVAWKADLHGYPPPCGATRAAGYMTGNSLYSAFLSAGGVMTIRFIHTGTNVNNTSTYTVVMDYIFDDTEPEPEEST